MVRRSAISLGDVADLENLHRAFWLAARGKRTRNEVRCFEANLSAELACLRRAILDLSVQLGRSTVFEIHDPKRRIIHAPAFRERVLHHAMMAQMGPVIERSLVADTFACRPGKGTLAAVWRAQHHARRFPWFGKVDIRSYFKSIERATLLALLRRRFKDSGLLALCARVVAAHPADDGRGLPIGALTSQYFANMYLGPLDRFLAEDLRVAAMSRYMDDIVWWAHTRSDAVAVRGDVERFVCERLRLALRDRGQVQRSSHGLSFLGFRVFPGQLLLSRRRRVRYARSRRRLEQAFALDLIPPRAVQTAYAAALATILHAQSTAWRRRELVSRPALDV